MSTDLNFWILTIMDMSTKLEYYADGLDKRVENLAVCLTMDTLGLYNEIMDLNDKKVLLINMKVLYDSLVCALKKDERLIVEEYAKNRTLDCIAKSLQVNRSTVMRRLNKAVSKCTAVLSAMGYTAKRLKDDYFDYFPVHNTFVRIKAEHTLRQKAAKSSAETAYGFETEAARIDKPDFGVKGESIVEGDGSVENVNVGVRKKGVVGF